MTKVIVIANQKGGVGKTTTAVNLAACMAVTEIPTLIIDMDPQSNATSGLGIELANGDKTIYDVMINGIDAKDVIRKSDLPHLDILPSSTRLVGAEIELVPALARETILKGALGSLDGAYEYIFIDCPPSLGLLTLNSLTAADTVLVPVQCEYFALEGLSQLLNTIRLVQKSLNKKLEVEGFLITMFDSRLNLSRQVAEEIRDYFKEKVFETVINRNVKLGEAPSFGKPIILYDAVSTGAGNYMNLVREMLENAG
ncbi:MAG: ParA family protein [Candidatus Marinimicrobia bacterium]|nr:ParA family protein [Candidatus Neomarinimicrobiota bacterium]